MARKSNESKTETTGEAKVSRADKVKAELAQIGSLGGPFETAAKKAADEYTAAEATMKVAKATLKNLRKSAQTFFAA